MQNFYNENPWLTFLLIIICVGVLVLYIAMAYAVLQIPKLLRYNKAILKLLAAIAEKETSDENLIKEMVLEADKDFNKDPHFSN